MSDLIPGLLPATRERLWWHRGDRPQAKARLKRRAYPIHAYIGPNGSGKSWTAAYDCMASLDFGRPVLSTCRLLDFRNPGPCPGGAYCDDPANHEITHYRWELVEQDGGPPILTGTKYATGEVHAKRHPYYVPWRTYQQLLAWRDGDVFADEITGFASSREIKNMPPQVANYLVQLRRRNVVLRWTTPSWGRADVIIREVSQAVTLCVGMFPARRPVKAGEAPRIWRDNRVFMVRTYDPQEFDEVEARRLESAKPGVWAMYVRPKGLTQDGYSTLDAVTSLGWANEAGVCIGCGGERARSRCSCPKEAHAHSHGPGDPGRASEAKPGGPAPSPSAAPRVPLIIAGRVAAVLPAAQDAAHANGSLDLVDAITLHAAHLADTDG